MCGIGILEVNGGHFELFLSFFCSLLAFFGTVQAIFKSHYMCISYRSFHEIPSLMDKIKEVDPDSVVDWGTMDDGRTFKRAFICPSMTRHALQYSQLVVSLDAYHTKNRKYPTQLLLQLYWMEIPMG